MITPLDIQNAEFGKGVRGYKEEDVDNFLDLLTVDYEKVLEENRALREQLKSMSAEVDRYRKNEGSLLETLEAAKALMGDISASAEKRAAILLKNAELDAELIQREAREGIDRLNEEFHTLRTNLSIFRSRYRALLEAELEKFDLLSAELFPEKNMEDLNKLTSTAGIATKTSAATTIFKESAAAKSEAGATTKTLVNFRVGGEE
ncbi:MAG: DivIVA domain-containing protein [Firmicutes bacterium]|nr:DivIVA domain-containing protein [Clostridiales bacterium]MBQ9930964.1 DivIVA domain-containing protein [Bacillota bacterium]